MVFFRVGFSGSLDKKIIQRTNYTVLDLLSDIGGILGLLMSFFSLLLSAFNFNLAENAVAS